MCFLFCLFFDVGVEVGLVQHSYEPFPYHIVHCNVVISVFGKIAISVLVIIILGF